MRSKPASGSWRSSVSQIFVSGRLRRDTSFWMRAGGRKLRWLGALGCLLWLPVPARAQAQNEVAEESPPEPAEEDAGTSSCSVGSPDRGRLRDSALLEETPYLFVRESRRRAQYGTAELVGLVQRSAAAVGLALEGPKLVVGDLSGRRGGRLSPHRSHRSGRDVDMGFYLLDAEGSMTQPPHFVPIRRDGCGRIRDDRFCFDASRNWALLSAVVQDPVARVQYVLVAPDIARRVIAEAERQGAPSELIERVRTVTQPHAGSHAHRSHFHVRIYCPVDDRPDCRDEPPFHPWYEGEPAPPGPAVRRLRLRQRRAAQRRAQQRARRRAARAQRSRTRRAAQRERRRAAIQAARERRAARRATE